MIAGGLPILTAEQMRAAEALHFRRVPQEHVMERAGAAVAREAARFATGRPILVLAGPGNNGGDAYVAARLLKERGHDVAVAACGEPGAGVARAMHDRWGGPVSFLYEARPRPFVIDGLFGTGMTRPLERGVAAVFAELVAAAEFTLAIDLPSGLDTDTGGDLGAPKGISGTLALGALKPAHVLGTGLERCGHILFDDIGIPAETNWRTIARPRLKTPSATSHKYTRGMIVVVEGAMPGAARLAARAAMAGGAGYVVVAGVAEAGPDALVHRRIDGAEALQDVLDDERIGAVVIGPGLGRDRRAESMLKAALGSPHPLILDGDALTLLGTSAAAWLQRRTAPSWLTPHAAEFERMFEGEGSKIDRTLAAAAASRAIILHKGVDTVIASYKGNVQILAGGSPWLSTAGTGDVLAGLLGAQVAANQTHSTSAAAWLHARAAQLAGPAFIADDLIGHIPQAISECL